MDQIEIMSCSVKLEKDDSITYEYNQPLLNGKKI